MSEELATNPVAEGENPAPEAEEVASQAEETELNEGENPDSQEQPDDSEELEHEGQKYRIPKAVKPLLMMQQDYTRKTQEVAEQRKALEQQQQQIAQQAQAQQEYVKDLGRLAVYDEHIEQWSKVNWQQLNGQDPQQAQALWFQFQQLKDARNKLAGDLYQKDQQRAFQAQQAAAKRMEESQAAIKREIPEWSPELASKLRDFVTSQGVTESDFSQITNPGAVMKLVHYAYVGKQLIDKQRQAAKPPAPVANPVPQVSARSAPAAKNPERMTTEEWMKYRNAQVAKRGR